jgi:hypothetical protein
MINDVATWRAQRDYSIDDRSWVLIGYDFQRWGWNAWRSDSENMQSDEDRKAAHEAAEASTSVQAPSRVRSRRGGGLKRSEKTVSFNDLPAYLRDNEFIGLR